MAFNPYRISSVLLLIKTIFKFFGSCREGDRNIPSFFEVKRGGEAKTLHHNNGGANPPSKGLEKAREEGEKKKKGGEEKKDDECGGLVS